MNDEKVDLRQGLDKGTPPIDDAVWPFKSGELWPTGASEPCVLRPEVPIMMNAATISMADRLQVIPMSRKPCLVGLVCHDNSLTHIPNNYTISILKSSTIPIHVDFTILTIADPVRIGTQLRRPGQMYRPRRWCTYQSGYRHSVPWRRGRCGRSKFRATTLIPFLRPRLLTSSSLAGTVRLLRGETLNIVKSFGVFVSLAGLCAGPTNPFKTSGDAFSTRI